MKMMTRPLALVTCALACVAAAAAAKSVKSPPQGKAPTKEQTAPAIKKSALSIQDAWVAEGPPSMKVTAAFFRVENRGSQDMAIVAARTDVARTVELHEVVNQNNMMAMRQVERFAIPAAGRLELRPGGLHLMLIGLTRALRTGDKVDLMLKFADGTEATVSATVRQRKEGDEKAGGEKMP